MILGDGDEIKQYLDSRFVSAPEAHHRIYGFEMHEELPNVVRLPIHLENEQQMFFDPENQRNMERALQRSKNTLLLQYFKHNQLNTGNAREITYQEFPNHFTWNKTKKDWKPRKQKRMAIGRMYSIPPSTGELFYLRLLLTVVKGTTSHANIRTVDGVLCESFKEACRKRGLLEDDREWRDCLNDGRLMKTGAFFLFVPITILYCYIRSCTSLFVCHHTLLLLSK
jgi:hypothetical protein